MQCLNLSILTTNIEVIFLFDFGSKLSVCQLVTVRLRLPKFWGLPFLFLLDILYQLINRCRFIRIANLEGIIIRKYFILSYSFVD